MAPDDQPNEPQVPSTDPQPPAQPAPGGDSPTPTPPAPDGGDGQGDLGLGGDSSGLPSADSGADAPNLPPTDPAPGGDPGVGGGDSTAPDQNPLPPADAGTQV